ncbi:E3 ubiquitin-protein ligase RGLG2-like [Cynara cardunculus var. scolymus]|uniref:Copine n=1 Tax=Cynara cardunculus var. scolymus TaxID=59895 RepID=A0A103YHG6_CYNCS|nr:E3 ubiquitin-protein ligase RGLG2-like [Cynara cardunculus var. scolymus]XP_024960636.1 E3 ubiquitin-protein ligase RGLG2-like [Cynara cardunculus var. scolymus]XP_024960644.1 E3 ubiquitin-protein ligase RGLG2-like [Cynara cardunculus var. scolymus]XP_024960652.1 E3 ubiquitin-protein ligase RGLG2-like [Cynara cardunculus var. scolymus]XP_024960661.1 E3 ubiquitin-protein ligase RGLG2-like [Cynara cardunculus var. scolymus]KVI09177.1 Copine [Cynara cardunculus var. scolymus]
MGAKTSRDEDASYNPASYRPASSFSGNQYDNYPQPSYSHPPQDDHNYPIQEAYPAYPQEHYPAPAATIPTATPAPAPAPALAYPPSHRPQNKFDRRYSTIADSYNSLEQVSEALARAGLESSNLILGIDFTKSNEWTGSRSFHRKSLHHIGEGLNPYEQAISIIGKTLTAFDEDNLIPCYGFGDASTHDQDVFSFYPEERCCNGFEEVLSRYREIVPHLNLAGPTSFAPVIEKAMTIVEESRGQYHVLVIIADGQVTRSVDTERGRLSPQEQKTVDAIVEASKLPLSIVLVGVGDGPWDTMKEFDDNIPSRSFDNFQFVNFTEIMTKNVPHIRKETEFALAALMEIPIQYKATIELSILGSRKGISPRRVALPPPVHIAPSFSSSKPSHSAGFQDPQSYFDQSSPVTATPYYAPTNLERTAPPVPNSTYENQLCPICLTNPKDMAFGCGHQTCYECGQTLKLCPICRSKIETRIKLY